MEFIFLRLFFSNIKFQVTFTAPVMPRCHHFLMVHNISYCLCNLLYLYILFCWWTFKLVPFVIIMNSEVINMGIQLSLWYGLRVFWHILRGVIDGSKSISMFSIFMNSIEHVPTYITTRREGFLCPHIITRMSHHSFS